MYMCIDKIPWMCLGLSPYIIFTVDMPPAAAPNRRICLSLYISIWISIYVYLDLSTYLSIYLYIYLHIYI